MSTLKTNTLTGTTSAGSILVTGEGGSTTTNLQQGLAKMWLIADMGDNAIDDSLNAASLTDHGTGRISFSITNVYLTNYIKIVYKTDYDNTININPTNYVFPGYVHVGQDPNIPNRKLINDWFNF